MSKISVRLETFNQDKLGTPKNYLVKELEKLNILLQDTNWKIVTAEEY